MRREPPMRPRRTDCTRTSGRGLRRQGAGSRPWCAADVTIGRAILSHGAALMANKGLYNSHTSSSPFQLTCVLRHVMAACAHLDRTTAGLRAQLAMRKLRHQRMG